MSRKTEYVTTKSAVMAVPKAKETDSYKPISHAELIDLTLASIYDAGFGVEREHYTMARDGNVANGRYLIKSLRDDEMQLQIGWQNSGDKSLSLKWAMGIHVFICNNGAVSGDMAAFRKKHTGSVQEFTPVAISEYVKTAGDVFVEMQNQRNVMKTIEISRRTSAELIGRAFFEEGFLQSTQLNVINRQINKPSFDYGAPNSLWELFQHVSFAMRDVHPSLWMENHLKAHRFFVNEAGILVTDVTPIIDVSPVVGDVVPSNQLNLFDDDAMIY